MVTLPDSLTLREDGVVLRDWRVADAPALEPVCGDPDVSRFTSVPWHYTPEAARAWMERQHTRRAAGTVLALAVTRAGEDTALGTVSLTRFSDDGSQAALGYWLVPAARGQGLASRAARMLCAWGFAEFGLARIELAILPDNTASHRVAERLGATRSGRRHDHPTAGGRTWELIVYALTPEALT